MLRTDPPQEYSPRLAPDQVIRAAGSFWSELYEGQSGLLNVMSGFLIGPRLHGVIRKQFSWPDQGIEAAEWVAHEAVLGRDVYQEATLAKPKRSKEPSQLTMLFAELHADDLAGLPQPTIVVENAPGIFQCYWRLREAVSIASGRKLVSKLGWECCRPMRVPGTLNHRYHGAPVIRVTRRGSESYDFEELSRLMSSRELEPPVSIEPVPDFGEDLRKVAAPVAIRAAIATAVSAIAILGGLAVPDAISEPRADIGSMSASLGFNEIRSSAFEAPDRVAQIEVLAVSIPRTVSPVPVAQPQRSDQAPTPNRFIREKIRDAVDTADGLPAQTVTIANTARETWTGYAETVWQVQ